MKLSKTWVADTLQGEASESLCATLISQTGLNWERGVVREVAHRTLQLVLPPANSEEAICRDLSRFLSIENANEMTSLSPKAWAKRLQEILPEEERLTWSAKLPAIYAEALRILGNEIADFGLSSAIQSRMPVSSKTESPFFELNYILSHVANALIGGRTSESHFIDLCENTYGTLEKCFSKLKEVYKALEEQGVSISLVYRLDSLTRALERVDLLLRLAVANAPAVSQGLSAKLFSELVRTCHDRTSLRELGASGLKLLARKMVERTGNTGEHYITRTKKEYFHMLFSAMGGGVLTVGTGSIKHLISMQGLHPLVLGAGSWVNYSASFLGLQFMGFSLATKQPSMTGPALAARLRDLDYSWNVNDFIDEVACLTRSQAAAFIGNLGSVIPAAFCFGMLFQWLSGETIYSGEYAHHNLESLHPWHSFSLLFAAWTGILLWLSSVMGAWCENWAVFNRIPKMIAEAKVLTSLVGKKKAQKISRWFSDDICGMGANFTLGFFLAGTPYFGSLLGIGMEVRHVTISMVSLMFSAHTMGTHLPIVDFLQALGGVIMIGLVNFSVSFSLALWIAAKARGVRKGWFVYLVKQIMGRFIKNPRPFLLP